jgi:hypothetical protein
MLGGSLVFGGGGELMVVGVWGGSRIGSRDSAKTTRKKLQSDRGRPARTPIDSLREGRGEVQQFNRVVSGPQLPPADRRQVKQERDDGGDRI